MCVRVNCFAAVVAVDAVVVVTIFAVDAAVAVVPLPF